MKNAPKKITDLTIKNATERLTIGDGLYLDVTPAGGKLWRYNYRFMGKQKTMAYGKWPDVSLALAKERHAEARRLLAQEPPIDPMAKKKAAKREAQREHDDSFKSVAEAYLDWWKPGKNEGHVERTVDGLTKDVYPFIGHMPIAQIEAPEIIAMAKRIEARGAEETAKRLLGKTDEVFSYAVANAIIKRNPCNDFKRSQVLKPIKAVNFARVDTKDVPTLMQKIELYRGTPVVRLALKLLAHTFVRPGKEFLGWRWSEIDWQEKTWTVPEERMKKKRTHVVPLATQTIALLKQLHTLTGDGELLFPAQKAHGNTEHLSDNTFNQALKRMGFEGKQTGHGFRGIASTGLYDKWKTTDPLKGEYIEMQLAHVGKDKTKRAYNHNEYIEQRTVMMQWWADYLEQAKAQPSNVVPFPLAS